jgi:23S rRNA (cytidine2498-2'-O)-methyltransferase
MRAFIVTPDFEPALEAELTTVCHARRPARPGVVICDDSSLVDPIFARQTLPDAIEIAAPSAQRLAEAAYSAIAARIDDPAATGPFTLHAFAWPPEPMLGSRVELVGRQLLTLLKDRRRRAFRNYRPPAPEATPEAGPDTFEPRALLVQLLALDRERMLISAAQPQPLPRGGTDLAPWLAGSAPVALDRSAPSRAYQKLEEAFRWLGTAPAAGQTCVDLGGAPGGWAWTALKRGASVTAVDRAALERPAAGHARLTGIIGNAFTFEPPHPVDWLLCDVVCEPARSLALIARWLERRWCRQLVVTVKFKGRDGYGILDGVAPLFADAGWRFARTKQLLHNKNEVTVLARER